ncbi:glycosyltransferase involved in cell wall biosynthesis [Arthrobacter sp. SORGH_AS 212]|uniref:glycosyltransferase family 4 protein n=1 Tax=Pseudarthrobacter sp. SORGH_AS 212 TaxID=3041777 RepID=UPI0027832EE1|nr:glycosyltransferase involved in cell wall biosynthesis [Arthrobacter sp. SORGH_AS_0212]
MRSNSIEILYPTGRDVPGWEKAHDEGRVPDRWPYGLHRIRTIVDSPPRYAEAFPWNPLSLVKSGSTIARTWFDDHTAIAWDEDTAIRLFMQRPRAKKFAGVIWATDRLTRREFNKKDLILRRILPKFDGLWVLSRAQEDVLRSWLGADAPPISYLPFGIDEDFFSPYPYPEQPLVLSVGRDRDRDPDTLFEALEAVKRARPEVDVAVQTMASMRPPTGVRTLPMMPHTELRKNYQAASVVAVATQPNVHVSGMTVALEAMATARPVVMSNTEGMSDYVEHGVTGLLTEPQDAASMVTAILHLLDHPEKGAEMGKKGRERVERHHTTQLMATTLSSFIQT